MLQKILEYAKIGLITFIVVYVVCTYILYHGYIPSESMEPTYMTGDRIIGNRLSRTYSRGDTVVFHMPDDKEFLYIKRIIGLPGETVHIADGHVYINGKQLHNDYEMTPEPELTFHIPNGCYFMMGDNRDNSYDSRYWDNPYVQEDEIEARVLFRYRLGGI